MSQSASVSPELHVEPAPGDAPLMGIEQGASWLEEEAQELEGGAQVPLPGNNPLP